MTGGLLETQINGCRQLAVPASQSIHRWRRLVDALVGGALESVRCYAGGVAFDRGLARYNCERVAGSGLADATDPAGRSR